MRETFSPLLTPEPENGLPVENVHETERDELFTRLERRVETVLAMKEAIAGMAPETEPEVFRDQIATVWREHLERFPEPAIEGFSKLEHLEKMAPRDDRGDFVDPADRAREQTLLSDDDVRFLWNMGKVNHSLSQKHEAVFSVATNKEPWPPKSEIVIKGISVDLTKSSLEMDAVHVIVSLDTDNYIKIAPRDTAAAHYMGSPISFVRSELSGSEHQKSVRHESIHNLLDMAPDIGTTLQNSILRSAVTAGSNNHPHVFRQVIEDNDQPNQMLDKFHHELLAHLDAVEWSRMPPLYSGTNPSVSDANFFSIAYKYSTAGAEAITLKLGLEEVARNDPESTIGLKAKGINESFTRRFTETISTMQQALLRAKELGPDVFERVHALFFVLPPSKYRHISRYLDSLESGGKSA